MDRQPPSWSERALMIALVVLVVVFVLPLRWLASVGESIHTANTAGDWAKIATIANGAASVAVALFTFALAWLASSQIRRLRESVDAQRDSIRAQRESITHMIEREQRELRAYVVVQSGAIENVVAGTPPVPNAPHAYVVNKAIGPVVTLGITNSGKTPARRVLTIANLVFREFPLTGQLPPLQATGQLQISVLGPGVGSTVRRNLQGQLIGPDQSRLVNGAAAVYIYGTITYVDAYDVERSTNFRLMYYSGSPLGTTMMNFCEEGNDLT